MSSNLGNRTVSNRVLSESPYSVGDSSLAEVPLAVTIDNTCLVL